MLSCRASMICCCHWSADSTPLKRELDLESPIGIRKLLAFRRREGLDPGLAVRSTISGLSLKDWMPPERCVFPEHVRRSG